MKKLLSLPPNLVESFHDVTGLSREEWFCTNDPIGHKLGSGGGTVWLLQQAFLQDSLAAEGQNAGTARQADTFFSWLSREKRVLLHAGGQSRRLPSYAPSGKILTPIPVFRWERGQRLSQDLLSLQVPLYERIMAKAPANLHTMVVSGDVLIRSSEPVAADPHVTLPDADVVCYGLWLSAETASHHGVFVMSRDNPTVLKQMLQKPSVAELNNIQDHHLYLTDIGVWMLSDRAVEVLAKRSQGVGEPGSQDALSYQNYDLYSDFGRALGTHPTVSDDEVNALSVAILPLPGGEFYHFGTSRELISSMLRIQNLVSDQREILHHGRKPHPSIFQQNAEKWTPFTAENQNVWVENSCISDGWTLEHDHIITGVPDNRWKISLRAGQCVDIVPIGESDWVVRPYMIDDTFSGEKQFERLFPVVSNVSDMGLVLRWMLGDESLQGGRMLWEESRRMSADEISSEANLRRLFAQRREFRHRNWPVLANNYAHSVFYQLDLEDAAREFSEARLPLPHPLPATAPLLIRMSDAMLRDEILLNRQQAQPDGSAQDAARPRDTQDASADSFSLLREALLSTAPDTSRAPRLSVHRDQIVWGRSPVRIDISGGWTDTPPYCLMEGGSVVNLAINLNGQQPLQTYVKPSPDFHIVLRSIDLGAHEVITTYEQLAEYNKVGSPFSIPKAALALAGFLPSYSSEHFPSLQEQLRQFGSGIELTMLSAIPAGSGLGTSSILAATVLGTLSDFCGLSWDKAEIGHRTLLLEQLLTTGGGWQDQYGGLLPGVKLLETGRGLSQQPLLRYLPDRLFTRSDYQACHLLYYTGLTRTAKHILAQIVRRMFLNQHDELQQLREMKQHAHAMYDAIQRDQFEEMGRLLRVNWQQNQLLDSGTNPPEVARLTSLVDDLCHGYKLPGAGGGGYLYMVAKDPEAAARIRQTLSEHRLNANARFVDMTLSETGLQVSRS
ncbi:MAG: bifunctional fucokinase/L-fucose-1-P-guanylyltransferase [Prevotella sp.]|nr:bifunctional fucokinase/L-fucose-1-P-guanylyltransferase [Prevotella sp.]